MNHHYLFLLHIWTEPPEEQSGHWRAALEEPHSGQQWAFANAEKLIAFLDRVAAGDWPTAPTHPVRGRRAQPAPGDLQST